LRPTNASVRLTSIFFPKESFPGAAISVIWTAPLTGIRTQYLDYLALKTQFFNNFLTGVIQFNPVCGSGSLGRPRVLSEPHFLFDSTRRPDAPDAPARVSLVSFPP
jgi:hypothetical protein